LTGFADFDFAYRELLSYLHPLRTRGDDGHRDDEDLSLQDSQEHNTPEYEVHLSHRDLVHAVEGYLAGVRRVSRFDRRTALGRAASIDSLIDLLQAEENLMIRTFGPPSVEHPHF